MSGHQDDDGRSAAAGDELLLWISGCCVGAAHARSAHRDGPLAWYLLETSGELAAPDAPPSSAGHR